MQYAHVYVHTTYSYTQRYLTTIKQQTGRKPVYLISPSSIYIIFSYYKLFKLSCTNLELSSHKVCAIRTNTVLLGTTFTREFSRLESNTQKRLIQQEPVFQPMNTFIRDVVVTQVDGLKWLHHHLHRNALSLYTWFYGVLSYVLLTMVKPSAVVAQQFN